MNSNKIPKILTIAGSDSGGGAGIQADLKTFAATGSYGASVITAVTAQNTIGVQGIQEINIDLIAQQIDSVCQDIQPSTVKTGMLFSNEIINLVSDKSLEYSWRYLIVDPVIVSTSGHKLLQDEAVNSYIEKLLPISYLTTPNRFEAEYLTGIRINDLDSMAEAAKIIYSHGVKNVIIKGGHLDNKKATDILYDGNIFLDISLDRINSVNTHGTGCSFSSAIASFIAHGNDLDEAFRLAKNYVWKGIKKSYSIGQGNGPINHMWDN